MVCNRWESEGLLHTSGELSAQDERSYQTHLQECSYCQEELASYSYMSETFFEQAILEEGPSFSMDELFDSVKAESHTATKEKQVKQEKATFLLGMPLFAFMQQRVAPAFLLVMGVFVGYSLLPNATTASQQVAENSTMTSPLQQENSAIQNQSSDSLREFREGGNMGIRSVDVVE